MSEIPETPESWFAKAKLRLSEESRANLCGECSSPGTCARFRTCLKGGPDWPPAASAFDKPEGTRARGSTGQLFAAMNGRWVRVPIGDRPPRIGVDYGREHGGKLT
jgi:hypothetical protein